MLDSLASIADRVITVTPDSHRAMQAEALAALLRERGAEVTSANSVSDGLAQARAIREAQGGVIIACGSLYFAGELRTVLGLPWRG